MANPEITYDLIESLIIQENVEGRQVHCVFGLPEGGETYESSASQAMNTASREGARNMVNGPSKSDVRNAVVAAFRSVSEHFSYDNAEGRWRKASEVVAGEAK